MRYLTKTNREAKNTLPEYNAFASDLFIYPFTHLPAFHLLNPYLLNHPLMHPWTYAPILWSTHVPIYPSIYLFIHPTIQSSTPSQVCPSIHSAHPFNNSSTHTFTHTFIYSSTCHLPEGCWRLMMVLYLPWYFKYKVN